MPRGRPRRGDSASDRRIDMRVTAKELEAYKLAAAKAKQGISHYLRFAVAIHIAVNGPPNARKVLFGE